MKNRAVFPIPRNSLVWLLVGVLMTMLPHFQRLPYWMWVITVVCILWRVQVFRQRWPFPNKVVRILFIIGGSVGVVLHHKTIFGPDAGVGLLTLAYLFKLLEMYKKRDAFLIVIVSYFVVATNYLFDTSFLSTLYTLVTTVVITAALVGLNQTTAQANPIRTVRLSLVLMLQSVPIMLVLFVFVPRIGPLWELSINSEEARTGIGDEITPGDISNLSRSSKLAFRVEFDDEIPSRQHLYWRGIVLTQFDGRTWYIDKTQYVRNYPQREERKIERFGDGIRYKVLLAPTNRNWLFALALADLELTNSYPTDDLTWIFREGVTKHTGYYAKSYLDFEYQPLALTKKQTEVYLQLPTEGNRRARRLAEELIKKLNNDEHVFAASLLKWINEEEFSYTLNPPKLFGDTIDQFIFDTRSGFCAHYAGAFVFLLRAAGIPARMIGGYQGGEMHPSGKYMSVYQYDAHAWVEYWAPGTGWRRMDPTAAIAPSRIMDGPFNATTDDSFFEDSPLSPNRLRNFKWFSQMRHYLEYSDYLWTKWIVNYDQATQRNFLEGILGQATPERIGAALAFIGSIFIAIFLVFLYRDHMQQERLNPLDKYYLKMCTKLAGKGYQRVPGETPLQYSERVSEGSPELAETVRDITDLYLKLRYRMPSPGDTEFNRKAGGDNGTLGRDFDNFRRAIRML